MAFQEARSDEAAGVGHGILILTLSEGNARKEEIRKE
jgi:hypothetical protein